MTTTVFKPILPRKRPLWLLILGLMLVFGFHQERAKIQLNHYMEVMRQNPVLQELPQDARAAWWEANPQPKRIHYYIMESTWDGFHRYSLRELGWMKWGLSSLILIVFFWPGCALFAHNGSHRKVALADCDVRFGGCHHGGVHCSDSGQIRLQCGP